MNKHLDMNPLKILKETKTNTERDGDCDSSTQTK